MYISSVESACFYTYIGDKGIMDDKKVITIQTADGPEEVRIEILPGETAVQVFQTVSETFGKGLNTTGRLCRKNGETLSGNLYTQVEDGDVITYEHYVLRSKVITVQEEFRIEILPGETAAQVFQAASEEFGKGLNTTGRLCRKNGETLSGNLYTQVEDGDVIYVLRGKVITVQTGCGSKETKVDILPGETAAQVFQVVSEAFGENINTSGPRLASGRLCRMNGETLSGSLYTQVEDGDVIVYESPPVMCYVRRRS